MVSGDGVFSSDLSVSTRGRRAGAAGADAGGRAVVLHDGPIPCSRRRRDRRFSATGIRLPLLPCGGSSARWLQGASSPRRPLPWRDWGCGGQAVVGGGAKKSGGVQQLRAEQSLTMATTWSVPVGLVLLGTLLLVWLSLFASGGDGCASSLARAVVLASTVAPMGDDGGFSDGFPAFRVGVMRSFGSPTFPVGGALVCRGIASPCRRACPGDVAVAEAATAQRNKIFRLLPRLGDAWLWCQRRSCGHLTSRRSAAHRLVRLLAVNGRTFCFGARAVVVGGWVFVFFVNARIQIRGCPGISPGRYATEFTALPQIRGSQNSGDGAFKARETAIMMHPRIQVMWFGFAGVLKQLYLLYPLGCISVCNRTFSLN